jgi:hypothetical protein
MRSNPVLACVCVMMLLVVPVYPVLASGTSPVSEEKLALFPGVLGITLTEVGIDSIRTRESLVEVHHGVVDVKIRDPLATSVGKRGVPDLSGDDDLAAVGDILARDGYVVTGVTEHQYHLAVTVEGASPSVREDVTYYTFTNVDTNTSRVVMVVQVVTSDGVPVGDRRIMVTPVGDRRIMVTPVVGEDGIIGSDELMVYDPAYGVPASGGRSSRGIDIECGGAPDEHTPLLLTRTGVAVNTVIAGTVGTAAIVACVVSGGVACVAIAGVMVSALVVFAGVHLVGAIVDTASYTTETRHVAEDSPIREFTLVKDSIGGGTYVAPGSRIHYRADGSVQVTTPASWWKRWNSKGLMSLYVPLTTDDTYAVTATRDIEAPSGSEFVFPASNTMTVKHKGDTILDVTIAADGGCDHDQNLDRSRRQDTAFYTGNRYLEFANQSHVSGIKHLEAQLVVPSSPHPPSCVRNAFVSLWIGVGPDDGSAIVQPVLGYDHTETGPKWAIAAWALGPNGDDIACGPNGHSEWRYPQVGDRLNLTLDYDRGRWKIDITDVTSHRSTWCSSDVVGNSDVEVFGGVLEGYKLHTVIKGENIADKNLPGVATFSNIQSNVRLTLKGVVHPDAQKCFTNLGVDISQDSKIVTLHTANR